MHVEIKVAQNFVLNFLFNKLPRRRVNLFGEELESALRDKFADHWYPDKPFKGSAYRCLKITDPADPVLNRAARESGNPVSDIVENLPADLAIWIDPGEVSYRIGEKGSVKILYSENDSNNYAVQNGLLATVPSSTHVEQVVPPPPPPPPPCQVVTTSSIQTVHSVLNSSSINSMNTSNPIQIVDEQCPDLSPISSGLSLPLDNLNSSMNSLNVSNNSQSNNSSNSNNMNGFAPFTPRPQQPVTYTAGSFAQTKFGSTKLKTNGKKPNRMSPTEFSNYIKQRAMQKQSSCPNNVPVVNNMTSMPIGNGHFRNNGFRNSSGGNSTSNNCNNGFYTQPNLNLATGSINCGRMQPQQQQQQQGSPDPFFYPLFPDRNQTQISGNGLSPSSSTSSSSSSCSMLFNGMAANAGSLSSSGSSSASSISSNPWSYNETEADSFLQDILNVGLNASPKQNHRGIYSSNSGDHMGFGTNGFGLGLSVAGLGGFGSNSLGGLFDPMSPMDDGQVMGTGKAVGGPVHSGSGNQQQHIQQQQQQQQHQRALTAN